LITTYGKMDTKNAVVNRGHFKEVTMDKFIAYLKTDIALYVGLFAFLGISEQLYNGIYGGHFVIKELTDIATFVFGQLSIKHGIDSAFNSNKGEMPSATRG